MFVDLIDKRLLNLLFSHKEEWNEAKIGVLVLSKGALLLVF